MSTTAPDMYLNADRFDCLSPFFIKILVGHGPRLVAAKLIQTEIPETIYLVDSKKALVTTYVSMLSSADCTG